MQKSSIPICYFFHLPDLLKRNRNICFYGVWARNDCILNGCLQLRTDQNTFSIDEIRSGILFLVLLLSFVLFVAFGKVLPGLNPFITLAFQLFSAVAQVTGNLISAITQVTGYLMRCLQVTAITQIFYAHGGSCQCHRVPM